MTAPPAAYLAFTAPINPPDASPALTRAQIWKGLERKVRHAEDFVGGAITATEVLDVSRDAKGREVITREVVFAEGNRKVKEVCTLYEDMKVEFLQTDGSRVLNTVSDSADGQIYMTYQFEWAMEKDASVETQQANLKKWRGMSKLAVESSIKAMREMVRDGRIQ